MITAKQSFVTWLILVSCAVLALLGGITILLVRVYHCAARPELIEFQSLREFWWVYTISVLATLPYLFLAGTKDRSGKRQ